MSAGPVLGFECEWFDNISGALTTLFLKFFLDDNTIEILTDGTRCLLKRIFYADVTVRDLFVGNSVTIFNRLLVIKKYCNEATTRYMGSREVHFLVTISREGSNSLGRVFAIARTYNLKIGKARTATESHNPVPNTAPGDMIIEFVGIDENKATLKFSEEVSNVSRWVAAQPSSIEAVDALFSDLRQANQYARNSACSLCLIKPHVIKEERVAELLDEIAANNFCISGIFYFHLTLPMAKELLDVYKDIYPSYATMIDQVVSAPVLALCITAPPDESCEVVDSFRELCGPLNAELALKIRPHTLRAKFGCTSPGGLSLCNNAVHCTDLAEDGEMECTFFFGTLAGL